MKKKEVVYRGTATVIRALPRRCSLLSTRTGGLVVFFDPPLERVGHIGVISYSNDHNRRGLERIFGIIPWDPNGEPLCAGIVLKKGDAGDTDSLCVLNGQKTLQFEYRSSGKHMASSSFLRELGYRRLGKLVERW